jgi:HEAT repeat protein
LEALPALLDVLQNWKPSGFRNPHYQLGQLTHKMEGRLQLEQLSLRRSVLESLGRMGPLAKEAVPAMADALKKDKDADVRKAVARALGEMGVHAKAAVRTLGAALKDEDVGVQTAAALSLGEIGPDAKDAVPALTAAQIRAAVALGAVDLEGTPGAR